mmetsp:Transcript_127110/g.355994  ORF Transcript_127110/g.355994 Transcript_127110/m.355994 type:complete len:218 (+) Transcript_127110:1050-1703(+)
MRTRPRKSWMRLCISRRWRSAGLNSTSGTPDFRASSMDAARRSLVALSAASAAFVNSALCLRLRPMGVVGSRSASRNSWAGRASSLAWAKALRSAVLAASVRSSASSAAGSSSSKRSAKPSRSSQQRRSALLAGAPCSGRHRDNGEEQREAVAAVDGVSDRVNNLSPTSEPKSADPAGDEHGVSAAPAGHPCVSADTARAASGQGATKMGPTAPATA